MATGKINALEVGNGSGPVTLTKQSAAKMWLRMNGSGTISINGSLNAASLVDNGTGSYFVNLSSSMSSTDNMSNVVDDNDRGVGECSISTVSQVRTQRRLNTSDSATDTTQAFWQLHGDLA